MAGVAEHLRDPGRGGRIMAEDEHPGARSDRGAKRRGWPAVQRDGLHLGQAPAEARAGEAEGGGSGMDPHLARGEVPRDRRPDAVAERIAGREHAHAPARARAELPGERGEGARPFEALPIVRRDHREMAGAADEGLRRVDRGARGRPQAVEAVLADPDDGEPCVHLTPLRRSR